MKSDFDENEMEEAVFDGFRDGSFKRSTLSAINRACEKFLEEREPGYRVMKEAWHKRWERGRGKNMAGRKK